MAGVQSHAESSDLLQDPSLIADRSLHDTSPSPVPDTSGPENLNYCRQCQSSSRCSPHKPSQGTYLKQAAPRLDEPPASSLVYNSFLQTIHSLILITRKKQRHALWLCFTHNPKWTPLRYPAERGKNVGSNKSEEIRFIH